jgi:hypothetical protein
MRRQGKQPSIGAKLLKMKSINIETGKGLTDVQKYTVKHEIERIQK